MRGRGWGGPCAGQSGRLRDVRCLRGLRGACSTWIVLPPPSPLGPLFKVSGLAAGGLRLSLAALVLIFAAVGDPPRREKSTCFHESEVWHSPEAPRRRSRECYAVTKMVSPQVGCLGDLLAGCSRNVPPSSNPRSGPFFECQPSIWWKHVAFSCRKPGRAADLRCRMRGLRCMGLQAAGQGAGRRLGDWLYTGGWRPCQSGRHTGGRAACLARSCPFLLLVSAHRNAVDDELRA